MFFAPSFAQACNFIKKETRVQVFSREFCEISKNTFLTKHLWATALKNLLNIRSEIWDNTLSGFITCMVYFKMV